MRRTQSKLTSGRKCQCPTCGEFFSSANMFDKHRDGSHDGGRHCLNPESVGMVIRDRGTGTYWTMPMPDGVVFGGTA